MAKKITNSSNNTLQLLVLAAIVMSLALGVVFISNNRQVALNSLATGNGGPSGAHYNLNIIGVPKGKTGDFTGGNRIFVPLYGNCKISLTQGAFSVLDGNCTDNSRANFQLPAPDPNNTGTTTYSVWARALGKPGGSSETSTCAIDPTTGLNWCSVYTMVQVRNTGKSTFTDVSKQLLYIYADLNADGTLERYPLFDSRLQDYYWNYDNNGLKLMQLRFYEIPSTVPAQ